jgi:hypothetical protein
MRGRFLPSYAELEAEVAMASDGGVGVSGDNCCSAQQWRRLRHLTLADGRQKRKKGTCGDPLEARGICIHTKIRRQRIHLQLGRRRSRTYSVSFVRGAPNYNDMILNRRIAMVLLQTTKIVMVPIKKPNPKCETRLGN